VSRAVSEDEVRQVANLARLGLTNDEVKKMGEEIGLILESVEQIGELNLSGVPPTPNPLNSTNVLRPDEPDVLLQCLVKISANSRRTMALLSSDTGLLLPRAFPAGNAYAS
jgi:aspartyl/glutamyl-tRNA(Asn/Gln) amidotransferase C subunit